MKIKELDENWNRRDSYQRDYDSSVSGMGVDHNFRNQERNAGLEHEQNHIAVYINGKMWKVFSGKGYADSREERQHLENMRKWAERKSAATGKKWTVGLTGQAPTAESVAESATAGATSAANIGTVVNPQLSPGKARGKKSYTGSMATGSGTKAPPQPKVVQPKKSDGTAVNALDMPGKKGNLFGSQAESMSTIKRR